MSAAKQEKPKPPQEPRETFNGPFKIQWIKIKPVNPSGDPVRRVYFQGVFNDANETLFFGFFNLGHLNQPDTIPWVDTLATSMADGTYTVNYTLVATEKTDEMTWTDNMKHNQGGGRAPRQASETIGPNVYYQVTIP